MFVFNILYQIKIYSEFYVMMLRLNQRPLTCQALLSYIHIFSLMSITSFKFLYIFSFLIEFAMETQRIF